MAIKGRGIIISGLSLAVIIGALSYKIDVLNSERKEIESTITRIEKNIDKLDEQIKEKDKLIEEKNNELKAKEEEIDKINKQLKDINEKYEKIKKQNDELQTTNSSTKQSKVRSSDYNISESEIDLLERLVFCEAGAESEEGQIAVVNVIFNRLNDDNFPDTITDIIYQKNQFSPVSNGKIDRVVADEQAKNSVQKALRGEKVISDESVYFFATWVRSDHPIRDHVNILQTIGVHHFGKWM